jgi:hypothetical protein
LSTWLVFVVICKLASIVISIALRILSNVLELVGCLQLIFIANYYL